MCVWVGRSEKESLFPYLTCRVAPADTQTTIGGCGKMDLGRRDNVRSQRHVALANTCFVYIVGHIQHTGVEGIVRGRGGRDRRATELSLTAGCQFDGG